MQLDHETKPETALRPVSKGAVWTGRGISILISLFLLADAVMKVIKLKSVVEYCVKYGLSASMLQGIGIILLICTIIYLIPTTAVLGAILLTGYLGGAILLHLRFADPMFTIVFVSIFGVLIWLALFLREPRLRALIPLRCPRAST